ncbi:hypothetical protein LCGC14_2241140, partial [marine sediment metagenome]
IVIHELLHVVTCHMRGSVERAIAGLVGTSVTGKVLNDELSARDEELCDTLSRSLGAWKIPRTGGNTHRKKGARRVENKNTDGK